ncbi:MAG: GNAT family N-acetyltransferase [Gammaproteobacteria bacterium]
MRGALDTARAAVRRMGLLDGSLFALSRLLDRISGGRLRLFKYQFVAQPVATVALLPEPGPQGIRVRAVSPADSVVAAFPRPAAVIAARFDAGATCLVAMKGEHFAGFLWLAEKRYMEDEVRCLYVLRPDNDAAWDFDVYVVPELRLTRTFLRLWSAANEFLTARGYRWSLSRISAFNPTSMAVHHRLGLQRLGAGIFVRAGKIQISFLTRAPFLHLSVRESTYPILRLRAPSSPRGATT